jgi:hypothetical protein
MLVSQEGEQGGEARNSNNVDVFRLIKPLFAPMQILLISLGRVLGRFSQAFNFRPSGRRVVESEKHLLRNGLFINTGGTVWHYWRERAPAHVRRSKGSGPLHPVMRLLHAIFPRMMWVGGKQSPYGFTIAIAAADGDCIFLNPAARKVARIFNGARLSRDQIELRKSWSRHVASPEFEVTEEGRVITETYVRGRHIRELPFQSQLKLVRHVFNEYRNLVEAEGVGSCESEIRVLRAACENGQIPASLSSHLVESDVLLGAGRWPLVPTGSDNSPDNVFVVGIETPPIFIDCMPMRWRPFFLHPIGLTVGWLVPELRKAFLAGELDAELVELFAAAQVSLNPTLSSRQTLMAISVALSQGSWSDQRISDVQWLTSAYGLDQPSSWFP